MQKQLRDGLILRSISEGFETDHQHLPQFYVDVFTGEGNPQDTVLGPWTEDLLSDQHPTMSHDDIWVIVDPAQGDRIVSATLLIPQVWNYQGVEFPVGRVELVATHKEYRRRGLIRELFNVAHERSESLGHLLQVITGIPHYYRQFGYGMAVDLGGDTGLPFSGFPKTDENTELKYTLRPAVESDIPQLEQWYAMHASNYLMSVIRTPERWRYDLCTRRPETPASVNYLIVQNQAGEGVGFIGIGDVKWGERLNLLEWVIGDRASYLDTFEDILRGIQKFALERFVGEQPSILMFDNGVPPAIKRMVHRTFPGRNSWKNYSWYLRTPSLPQFLMNLAPALERNLEGSAAHRFTGQIGIDFYDKTGLLMKFENGKLIEATDLPADQEPDGAAPWHMFQNILFGHRTYEEMFHILPEVWFNRKADTVLPALFPNQRSWLMGVM